MASERHSPPFTPARIEALEPRTKDFELADPATPGLVLRVRSSGTKTFCWYIQSINRKITLGPWAKTPKPGHVTLAEARMWLDRLREAHKGGRLSEVESELPARRRPHQQETSAATVTGPTVRDLAKDFRTYVERRRKRPEQAVRPLDLDILPAIGDRAISSITALDCRQIVEAVVARGSPRQAGIVLAVLKQLFNFAWGRGDLAMNPTAPLRDPEALGVTHGVCQRFLTASEIAAFWKALDAYKGMTPTVRLGLKVILLTGVRSGELLQAELSELDLEAATWTVPVAHQKLTRRQEQKARPWAVPLAPTVLGFFRELEALAKSQRSRFVMASFHAEGEPLTEKSLNHAMRRLFTGKEPLLSFAGERPTPHDLRRTMRTHLGDKLGVPWHIAERCLNHSLGKITATYDVGDYLAERRAALEKWDTYVQRLVSPAESRVAFLPGTHPAGT